MRLNPLFANGPLVPPISFGASPLGNVFGEISANEGEQTVHLAIERGINFFDTSPYYGLTLSEQRLGEALRGRRDQVVLATKCGRYGESQFDFTAGAITRGLEASLRRLQTDHVDLLQVHDCEFTTVEQVVNETLPALEACRAAGRTRWIGITGYGLLNLRTIAEQALSRGIQLDCILSYCRQNLANTDMETMLAPFADRQKLGLINASPMHMGLLTEAAAPSWHPAKPEARKAAARAAAVCRREGFRLEEVAMAYAASIQATPTTLVGMGTTDALLDNLSAIELTGLEPLIGEVQNILREGGASAIWPSGLRENWDVAAAAKVEMQEGAEHEGIAG